MVCPDPVQGDAAQQHRTMAGAMHNMPQPMWAFALRRRTTPAHSLTRSVTPRAPDDAGNGTRGVTVDVTSDVTGDTLVDTLSVNVRRHFGCTPRAPRCSSRGRSVRC